MLKQDAIVTPRECQERSYIDLILTCKLGQLVKTLHGFDESPDSYGAKVLLSLQAIRYELPNLETQADSRTYHGAASARLVIAQIVRHLQTIDRAINDRHLID